MRTEDALWKLGVPNCLSTEGHVRMLRKWHSPAAQRKHISNLFAPPFYTQALWHRRPAGACITGNLPRRNTSNTAGQAALCDCDGWVGAGVRRAADGGRNSCCALFALMLLQPPHHQRAVQPSAGTPPPFLQPHLQASTQTRQCTTWPTPKTTARQGGDC